MTYKEALTAAMTDLAQDPLVCFIGYGLLHGRAAGTLKGVPEAQIIETPVAENLMVGLAIGMALAGRRPVVYIERFDFILNALDAIVNHLDKMERLSRSGIKKHPTPNTQHPTSNEGLFAPCIILRVVVGNKSQGNPPTRLLTGLTHTQDFTMALREMVSFPVKKLEQADGIRPAYMVAHQDLVCGQRRSTMLVEMKDLI